MSQNNGLRRPSFEHFFSGDDEDHQGPDPTAGGRAQNRHSLSDVVEANEYHDAPERPRYRLSQHRRSGELNPEEREPTGVRSTIRTQHSQLTRADTIATRQGPKSMKDITDAFGVEGSARPISKTFVRPSPPQELLDYPVIMNQRVSMNIFIMAPL